MPRPKKQHDFERQTITVEQEAPSDDGYQPAPISDFVVNEIAGKPVDPEEELVTLHVPADGGCHSWRFLPDGEKEEVIEVSINGKTTVVKVNAQNTVPRSVAEVLQRRFEYSAGVRHQQFSVTGKAG